MQGRDKIGQPTNRDRERNGRGGCGMARPPPRTGTEADVGAYLDLIPEKEVNPREVTNWINKLREYVVTVCETFELDATLGDYPELLEQIAPEETRSKFEIRMWELVYAKYTKDRDRLEADKVQTHVAKILHLAKRVKPETRVTVSDIVNLAKLRRLLSCIRHTRRRGIVLRVGRTMIARAFINGAYRVHKDMRNYTWRIRSRICVVCQAEDCHQVEQRSRACGHVQHC